MKKILVVCYLISIVALFLYSFTQIDLSLTFSKNAFVASTIKWFQQLGYFNRPLSASVYLGLLLALFSCYAGFLFLAHKKKLQKKLVWTLILGTTLLLTFTYNAFSYDLFNYIFDAKIVTYYHQNPYEHKAADYLGDPMLSFMRWVHRTYPYGPAWLVITVPVSFLGMQHFLPTVFLFKLLASLSFLGSLFYLGKILQKIAPDREVFGLVFFGLNPLILIESLVSAHVDSVMAFFFLWSFYLLVREKYLSSYLLFFFSVGIKFATGFLLPVYLWLTFLHKKKKKIIWEQVVTFGAVLVLGSVIAATMRGNFQPWYFISLFAFVSILANRFYLVIPSFILSIGALLTYYPYLLTGNWDPPIPQQLQTVYYSSIGIALVGTLAVGILKKKKHV